VPLYSAFTPFGLLDYSSDPSPAENIYNAGAKLLGAPENFSLEPGSHAEAMLYADAMGLARVFQTDRKMRNQLDPLKATDMLPVYEAAYGLIPKPTDTIPQRQAALASAMRAPEGATVAAVTAALQAALGSDFVSYRLTPVSEIVNFPASPGDANSPSKWTDKGVSPQVVRLTGAVVSLGVPVAVPYETIVDAGEPRILVGEQIVVSVNNIGLAERVNITAIGAGTFTATFTKVHEVGDIATTAYFPFWRTTKKHSLVVLTRAATLDPEKRRTVNEIMKRMVTGWSTWAISPKIDGTHAGGFIVDDATRGRVDFNNIDTFTYP